MFNVTAEGADYSVCKKAFANIHGITLGRMDHVPNLQTATNMPKPDARGTHGNHISVPSHQQQLFIDHLSSLPTITSHYSRKTEPDCRYLDIGIKNKNEVFELYTLWFAETHPGEEPVSCHYYLDTWRKYFKKLLLYKKRTDTCKFCDIEKEKEKVAITEAERRRIATGIRLHLNKVQRGYDLVQEMKDAAGDDTFVICLDLQQALPTPRLTTSIAFYKRKLWTFKGPVTV